MIGRRMMMAAAGVGGGSVWTPSALFQSGEEGAWYSPRDLSTLFQDAAGTTPVENDGDPVGYIADKSGNGNDITQNTASLKMTYRTDGTHHWLESVNDVLTGSAIITSAAELTVVAAINLQSSVGYSAGFRTIVGQGTHPTQDFGVYWATDRADDLILITDSEDTRWEIDAPTESEDTWTVWAVRGEDANQTFHQDGSPVGSASQTTFAPAGSQTFRLGYEGGSDRYWNGYFGDIVVVGKFISNTNRALAENFAAGGIGI